MGDTRRAKKGERRRTLPRVPGLGYLPVWLLLAGYFVWLCSQMAGEAPSGIGGASLIGIGVAVLVGIIAGGVAMVLSRSRRGS